MIVATLLAVGAAGALAADAVVGADKCTQGPTYWCSSPASATECKVDSKICWKYCQNTAEYSSLKDSEVCKQFSVPGADPCTWGPSYWCASKDNVNKCLKGNSTECTQFCASDASLKDSEVCKASPPVVGGDPCTWGPSYWCASAENAAKCKFNTTECKERYCKNVANLKDSPLCTGSGSASDPGAAIPMVGTNKCTYGPSYWCSSQENAKSCNFTWAIECGKYCEAAKNGSEYNDIAKGDVCTSPCLANPAYYCNTTAQAKACGIKPFMCRPYCLDAANKASKTPVCMKQPKVSKACLKGPAHWCSKGDKAKACRIPTASCQTFCAQLAKYPTLAKSPICERWAMPTAQPAATLPAATAPAPAATAPTAAAPTVAATLPAATAPSS